jgi:hypothetical protein
MSVKGVFGLLVFAFDDFDARRLRQTAAHGHDGGVVAERGAQVVRRNDGGANGQVRPTHQHHQRPDQPRTEFFEDEYEHEHEKRDGKQRAERQVNDFGEQQPDDVARNDSDERTFHTASLPVFPPAANHPNYKQAQSAAERVNHHVMHGRRARRHENLMKFVTRRVERHDQQRKPRFTPVPRTRIVF